MIPRNDDVNVYNTTEQRSNGAIEGIVFSSYLNSGDIQTESDDVIHTLELILLRDRYFKM